MKPNPPFPDTSHSEQFPSFVQGDSPPTDNMGKGRVTVKTVAYCDDPNNAKVIAFTKYYQKVVTEVEERDEWVFLWMEHNVYTRDVTETWRAYIYCDNTNSEWDLYHTEYGSWKKMARRGIDVFGFIPVGEGDEFSLGVSTGPGRKPGFTFEYEKKGKGGGGGFKYDGNGRPMPNMDADGLVQDAIDQYRKKGYIEKGPLAYVQDINMDIFQTHLEVDTSGLRSQPTLTDIDLSSFESNTHHSDTIVHTVRRPMLTNSAKDKFIPYFGRSGQELGISVGSTLTWEDIPDDFRPYMSATDTRSTFEVVSIDFVDRNDLPTRDTLYIYGVQAIVALREKQRSDLVSSTSE